MDISRMLLTVALAGTMMLTGCMSLEERLASNDPAVKRNAEYELIANSRRTGSEPDRIAAIKRVTDSQLLTEIALAAHPEQKKKHGTVPSTIPDGMAALEKLTDQKSLFKLAADANAKEIKSAALDKVSDQGYLLKLFSKEDTDAKTKKRILSRLDAATLREIPYCSDLIPFWRKLSSQKILAACYRDGYETLTADERKELVSKLTDQVVLEKMVREPGFNELNNKTHEIEQKYNHTVISKELGTLREFYSHAPFARHQFVSNLDGQRDIEKLKRLLRNAASRDGRFDENALSRVFQTEAMIQRDIESELFYVTNDIARQALYAQLSEPTVIKIIEHGLLSTEDERRLLDKLPDDQVVKVALEPLNAYNEYTWSERNMYVLERAIRFASCTKEEKNKIKILSAILRKIESVRRACLSHTLGSWNSGDIQQATQLVERFPKISDVAYGVLVCLDGMGWKYLLKNITPEIAYVILTQRKAKSEELETELAKMLPAEKIDMKVYEAVRCDAAQKAVVAKMSADMKKSISEKNSKAFALVEEKAKAAAKETFELHGFYLGMDWEDMKTVLAHHFPDLEIKEMRDGESNDDAYIIDLPNQRAPFCYASAKDKKVYKFNFGKKLLKKWYSYDVQTFREWAKAYSRENKIDMRYKEIEKEATVTEPMDWSRSYRVWFHQESYQYKHNTKEYRLTYFGEEKDFTVHGGLGGALIKEAAAPQFRYVRGDPGSLRAAIEND